MKELCKTFFKFNNKIIDGWKILNENGEYNIYTYTSCEELGNWQLFLSYNKFQKILNYFEKQVQQDKIFNVIDDKSLDFANIIEYHKTAQKWNKNTLDKLLKYQQEEIIKRGFDNFKKLNIKN